MKTKLKSDSPLRAATCSRLVVGLAALSERIFVGRLCKDGRTWREGKQDVTSDVLDSVVKLVQPGYALEVKVNGVPKYRISVEEIKSSENVDVHPRADEQTPPSEQDAARPLGGTLCSLSSLLESGRVYYGGEGIKSPSGQATIQVLYSSETRQPLGPDEALSLGIHPDPSPTGCPLAEAVRELLLSHESQDLMGSSRQTEPMFSRSA